MFRLAVVLYSKTYLFNLFDLTLIDNLDTIDNPHGLCDLVYQQKADPSDSASILATLDLEEGSFRLRKMKDMTEEYVVPAHTEALSALRLSDCGNYLATSCVNGQYIRIWEWPCDKNGAMKNP